MGLFNLFKKKEKLSDFDKQVVDYIIKYRGLNVTDEEIKSRFRTKNYPEELINKVFDLANKERRIVTQNVELSEEVALNKELKKYPRRDRERLKFLWKEYHKGNVLKIGDNDGKISG